MGLIGTLALLDGAVAVMLFVFGPGTPTCAPSGYVLVTMPSATSPCRWAFRYRHRWPDVIVAGDDGMGISGGCQIIRKPCPELSQSAADAAGHAPKVDRRARKGPCRVGRYRLQLSPVGIAVAGLTAYRRYAIIRVASPGEGAVGAKSSGFWTGGAEGRK
jgi:hypothetical protein